MYSKEQFAKLMDSTLLRPTATREDVTRACEEAMQYHFATLVVFPFWLPVARRAIQGSDVKPASVVGFPFGAGGRAAKLSEARSAISSGA